MQELSGTSKIRPFGSKSCSHGSMKNRTFNKLQAQFAYGHREILLEYFGLPMNSPFTGVLQHGAGTTPMLFGDRKTPRIGMRRIPHLVWSKLVAQELHDLGDSKAVSIGSPWAYLHASIHEKKQDIRSIPNSILYFPTHHSLSVDRDLTSSQFRSILIKLKEQFPSAKLSACLYYSEFLLRELHIVAEDEGVRLVCPGIGGWDRNWTPHPARVNFLKNLYSIISESERVIFESFTTGIFYAASLKKQILYQPSLSNQKFDTFGIEHRIQSEWMDSSIFASHDFVTSDKYDDVTNYMLGLSDLLTKEELFEIVTIDELDVFP